MYTHVNANDQLEYSSEFPSFPSYLSLCRMNDITGCRNVCIQLYVWHSDTYVVRIQTFSSRVVDVGMSKEPDIRSTQNTHHTIHLDKMKTWIVLLFKKIYCVRSPMQIRTAIKIPQVMVLIPNVIFSERLPVLWCQLNKILKYKIT